MKSNLMTHYCMNKECDWEETSHKIRDGVRCPKCEGLVKSYAAYRVDRSGKHKMNIIIDTIQDKRQKVKDRLLYLENEKKSLQEELIDIDKRIEKHHSYLKEFDNAINILAAKNYKKSIGWYE